MVLAYSLGVAPTPRRKANRRPPMNGVPVSNARL
jgi:hypothetical protein